MIGKLKGRVDTLGTDSVILDVGGVGYHVFCSANTLRALPEPGLATTLLTDMHVREDHIHLFGFVSDAERRWFRALQDVQGVGAKVALSLLSSATPHTLSQAIAAQDPAPLTEAAGVGPKLAKRILVEMKDRAAKIGADAPRTAGPGEPPIAVEDANHQDAISALVNLGYGRTEAFAAVAAAARAPGEHGVEDLIRGGLKELAGSR